MASVTLENQAAFRKAYAAAVKSGAETFEFEGHTVLTAYAKYVIEYMESQT